MGLPFPHCRQNEAFGIALAKHSMPASALVALSLSLFLSPFRYSCTRPRARLCSVEKVSEGNRAALLEQTVSQTA
jgi:hypothetical protein